LLDSNDRVLRMNAAAESLLVLSSRRASGEQLGELSPEYLPVDDLCARARKRQRSVGRTVHLFSPTRPEGDRQLTVRVSPIDENATGHLLVEMLDITRRQVLDRETALASQRLVSRRMLEQLAHEVRNPLGGLRGAAQLLERELTSPEQREFTRVIIGEADRLESLMAGLLGPRQQPQFRMTNVHEILEHVVTIVVSEAPQLRLQRDYDPSLPTVLVDRDQVTQAVLNVMRNAAQATNGTGALIVRTRVKVNHVVNMQRYKLVAVLEIEDDGPGIAADIAGTIFYPFVSNREGGSGIGLPLAQELINRHRGFIEFTTRPGSTVFTISLPISSTPPPAAAS
jgi:two-component system nitrogen regulation sensor histidine kinase GlnL